MIEVHETVVDRTNAKRNGTATKMVVFPYLLYHSYIAVSTKYYGVASRRYSIPSVYQTHQVTLTCVFSLPCR